MRTVNFSDARNNLKAVFDRVVEDADTTIITRRDAEDVVVMPLSTWNSWQETEYLLSNPANAKWLRESIAQSDAGKSFARDFIEPRRTLQVREPAATYQARSKRPRSAPRKKTGK
ncbi:MAG: type II toxin-antitoxin system prevent-host-death family antitoxin [Proteobacteria bacterium]|nr:type II toxin-antitoxin system prevent-host-death family antitoxin [Pseudomonadota bacterium]